MLIEWTSESTCRVRECSWFVDEFEYDDEIEVAPAPVPESYRFLSLVQRSPLVRTTFVVDPTTADSPMLGALFAAVDAAGGYWERAFGGAVFVALPPGSGVSIEDALST